MKRESVEGRFYLEGFGGYITFRKGKDGDTEYEFDDGRRGNLPTISRIKVKDAICKLLGRSVQPIFIP